MANGQRTGSAPVTVSAAVAERLRQEIRDGQLQPGARLRQAHVAEEFGVSTTPVREAFVALEREGLVQSIAHRGVVVFQLDAADLREIYEIRIPLEALATELAIPNLTEADLTALEKTLTSMSKAAKRKDMSRAGDLNDEFHSRIYTAAERPRLLGMISDLRASSRPYTGFFATFRSLLDDTEKEHQAIFDALRAGAPKKAARATAVHLQHTLDVVAAELESQSEQA
jgi:DNA-binding GntR family transcriptional regulator